MTVYAVRDDGIEYQQLDLDLTDLFDLIPEDFEIEDVTEFSRRNTRLSSFWKAPNTTFTPRPAKPDGTIPDISLWVDATLVLSPRAHNYLKDSLQPYGEFLPVMIAGDQYMIFHCREIGDVIPSSVEYDKEGDIQLGVKAFTFDESVEKKLVFKTPVEGSLTLYCNELFKTFVEESELNGLEFDRNILVV